MSSVPTNSAENPPAKIVTTIPARWVTKATTSIAFKPTKSTIGFVSIVTPNHFHSPIALAFVETGFNAVLDKPMVRTSEQAARPIEAVEGSVVFFAITYNHTGYPMVRQARHMVRRGDLGEIRKVIVEYHQGWLASHLEAAGNKQAEWRTDPARSGVAGAVGDIGSHAENLVSAVTDLRVHKICADLDTFVPGRLLDDDVNILRFEGGAKGSSWPPRSPPARRTT